jgi:hypothetical protein
MPRPSTTDAIEPTQDITQRLNMSMNSSTSLPSTVAVHPNSSLVLTSDLSNSNTTFLSSSDHHQNSSTMIPPPTLSQSAPPPIPRLLSQMSLSSSLAEDIVMAANPLSTSLHEHDHDTDVCSSSNIPLLRHSSTNFDDYSTSITSLTDSPPTRVHSSSISPMPSFCSTTILVPIMNDKSLANMNDHDIHTNSKQHDIMATIDETTSIINSKLTID